MSISTRQLFKNTSVIMLSQVFTWALTLLLTLFLPRYLGVANIGALNLASSLWAIVAILSTFGMDVYLTREIAKDPTRLNTLFSQSLVVRLILFAAGAVVLFVYSISAGYRPETLQIILIIGVSALVGNLNGGVLAALQGLERMEFLALSAMVGSFIATTLSLLAIFGGYGVTTIAWISCLGAGVSLALAGAALLRIFPMRISFSVKGLKSFLLASLSFFLLYLFINLYQQIDVVVIAALVSEKGVGWYSVADRLIGTLMFIPTVFMTVFLPTFSRLHVEAPDQLNSLFRRVFDVMFLTGVAVGFGVTIIAGSLIKIVYGLEFERSIPILAFRGLITVFTFINILVGMYLIATNRQKPWIVVIAIAALATIPLDMFFVPYCERMYNNGALGGAFAYLFTEAGMVFAGAVLLPKGVLCWKNFSYALRALLAGLVMILGTRWLAGGVLWLQVPIGAIIFVITAVLLRLITRGEWIFLKGLLGSAAGKFRGRTIRTAH